MSWRDSQRFLKIASIVRHAGWALAAVILGLGAVAVLDSDGDDSLFVVRLVGIALAVLISLTQGAAWFIEKHAERVVVR